MKNIQEFEEFIRSIVRDELARLSTKLESKKQPEKDKFQTYIEELLPKGKTYSSFEIGAFWVKIPVKSTSIRSLYVAHCYGKLGWIDIEFHNNPSCRYRYEIPLELMKEFVLSNSRGSFFARRIIHKYNPFDQGNYKIQSVNN